MLTKTERVLSLDSVDREDEKQPVALFANTDDDSGVVLTVCGFSREDWIEFGSPSKITVTIEPGDMLNGEK